MFPTLLLVKLIVMRLIFLSVCVVCVYKNISQHRRSFNLLGLLLKLFHSYICPAKFIILNKQ